MTPNIKSYGKKTCSVTNILCSSWTEKEKNKKQNWITLPRLWMAAAVVLWSRNSLIFVLFFSVIDYRGPGLIRVCCVLSKYLLEYREDKNSQPQPWHCRGRGQYKQTSRKAEEALTEGGYNTLHRRTHKVVGRHTFVPLQLFCVRQCKIIFYCLLIWLKKS